MTQRKRIEARRSHGASPAGARATLVSDPPSPERSEQLRAWGEKSRARRAAGLTQEADRARYARDAWYRERQRESAQGWRKRNPEKIAAQHAVRLAIRHGEMVRQPCGVCGARAHAHHADYGQPLEVRWLCPLHHMRQHAVEGRL